MKAKPQSEPYNTRQIHTDIRAVQQQHPAGDGGPRRPSRRDMHHRPPLTTAGACNDLLLMGQEQGFPVTPPAPPPPPPPPPPPLPSRSSLSLVWKRLRERRLNVRRRKPIIFLIHKVRRSLLCPGKVFHTTGGEAGVLLLLLSPPPPPRPPRGEESLSRHGGDFRTADQSFGWMSAGDPSRILMKLTQKDHRGANQLINWPGVNDSHGNTSSPPPPPVLSSSCAPASCFACCCAPTLKYRRNPNRRFRRGSHTGPGRGSKDWSPLHRNPGGGCCLFPPANRNYLTAAPVNQRHLSDTRLYHEWFPRCGPRFLKDR
ncbi:hypothetical protein KUCAC02_013588 [Chaenocephalus aceratus]|uniref:Uncharacterized protein n=1 Tax=Chaenocephalus aceratus TaxID=36190 RepID=A0ACB9WD14_CHAAC|nr:hypothetical protein KUCAC02_013588 [Chaenocephalus aceratus]